MIKLLFMGTPEFAAVQLRALIAAGYEIAGVVTRQDKPVGRHKVMTAPPVKLTALEHGIRVFQPATLRDGSFNDILYELAPDMIVVAAYGRILPPDIISYPKLGCVNVHGSLLPRWRGAAPIQRAIMAGDDRLGVTIMRMDDGIDTGDMILSGSFAPDENDNYGTVHDKLAALGAELLIKAIEQIENGSAVYERQCGEGMTYASKIENSDCVIDFTRRAQELVWQIKGLYPEPLAYCTLRGNKLKLTEAFLSDEISGAPCGCVFSIGDGTVKVACGDSTLIIKGVHPAGKSAMSASDFIRGRNIAEGDMLTTSI